jgi:hypothetical protein
MDRRLLFPAAAATVWAQQVSPAAAEAEKALRDRVQQYYQLQVEKKFRQAEAMVAEDSKEDYYNGKKPNIRGFSIDRVEFQDNGTTATVTIKAKVLVLMPGAGAQVFEMPSPTHWKLENGLWCWYIPPEAKVTTPFGKLQIAEGSAGQTPDPKGKAPDLAALVGQVSINRTSVDFGAGRDEQSVTITNGLPGPLDLRVDPHAEQIRGLSVAIDKTHLESGEKATLHFRMTGNAKIADVVEVTAFPINRAFDIQVKGN